MGDLVKIIAKTALIVIVMASATALLGGVVMPSINVAPLTAGIGKGLAILYYYCEDYIWLFSTGTVLLGIKYILIPTFKVASIAWRWIMKVNE